MLIIFANFIANLRGPEFLLLYLIVIVFAILIFVIARGVLESWNSGGGFSHSTVLNAYEVAYLRGGTKSLINLAIFNLTQKRFLQQKTNSGTFRLRKNKKQNDTETIDDIEKKVLSQFPNETVEIKQIDEGKVLSDYIEQNTDHQQKLEVQGLLLSQSQRKTISNLKLLLILMVISLGGYKLIVALSNGHSNVAFLLILGAIGVIILSSFGISRLTKKGKAHLAYLESTYQTAKLSLSQRLEDDINSHGSGAYSETGTLLLGIYGLGVLSETDNYSDFGQEFANDKHFHYSSGWGGYGGGCSTGSSCGSSCSSCGGGCGGCGGCGG